MALMSGEGTVVDSVVGRLYATEWRWSGGSSSMWTDPSRWHDNMRASAERTVEPVMRQTDADRLHHGRAQRAFVRVLG